MNLFVADPGWGWWIILYFYLGGLAAGAYFVATLIELRGRETDRELSRAGYWIAFPAISLCGILLIVDLHRPERFWHMLLKSEVVDRALIDGWPYSAESWSLIWHAPLLKYWSPMSVGSWALSLFGLCSFLSFIGSLRPTGRLAWLLHHGLVGKMLATVGSLVGFFIAAYTGALLGATNQPIWSDSVWIAPLFLTSAASTGIAAMILLVHWRGAAPSESVDRLERADVGALAMELAVFAVFLASLGANVTVLWSTVGGKVFIVGTLVLGLLAPLAIHLRMGLKAQRAALAAATLALIGGFLLRYGLLSTAPQVLQERAAAVSVVDSIEEGKPVIPGFSPEDGRLRGGGPGADAGNRVGAIEPRSKVFGKP